MGWIETRRAHHSDWIREHWLIAQHCSCFEADVQRILR
uniref:Uncharacterized protein n=1 Tax=Arundo donax TaxID=35708 RepID=A0A0A9AE27_ARUDO